MHSSGSTVSLWPGVGNDILHALFDGKSDKRRAIRAVCENVNCHSGKVSKYVVQPVALLRVTIYQVLDGRLAGEGTGEGDSEEESRAFLSSLRQLTQCAPQRWVSKQLEVWSPS